MNLWDLKNIGSIFDVSASKAPSAANQQFQGFSLCHPPDVHSRQQSQVESSGTLVATVLNHDDTLQFEDLAKVKPRKGEKNISQFLLKEDESWFAEDSKSLTFKNTERSGKNLKSITSRVYHYLKQYNSSTYEQLMTEVFNCSKNATNPRDKGKNIRRRLYDAINVMIASNILRKQKNHIFFNANVDGSKFLNQGENNEKVQQDLDDKREILDCKRKILRKFKKIDNYLQQLISRNASKPQREKKLQFPLTFVQKDKIKSFSQEKKQKMTLNYPIDQVHMESQLEVLQKLFPGKTRRGNYK